MNKTSTGIRITTISRIAALIGVTLLMVTLYALYLIVNRYNTMSKSIEVFISSQTDIASIQNASDYMTSQVRMYVSTGDKLYMDNYFEVVNECTREKALESLSNTLDKEQYSQSLKTVEKALSGSNAMMDYELHAMKLVWQSKNEDMYGAPDAVIKYNLPEIEEALSPESKAQRAYDLVYGVDYRIAKNTIDHDIETSIDFISKELKLDTQTSDTELLSSIKEVTFAIVMLFLLVIITFTIVGFVIVKPLRIFVNCIEEDKPFEIIGSYELRYMAKTYNNIYELNKLRQDQMKFKIEHDALTNVFSRQAFEENKAILANDHKPMALLMIDVDKFKDINDTYGHEKGDEVLIYIAKTLKGSFRDSDIIARIGGDEFAVLMMNATENEIPAIGAIINRINTKLQNPDEIQIKTSLSVGIAFSKAGYQDEMYIKADQALYTTKENGRAGYSIYKE
ncbi:MAG: diguanylate cyclase [Pseudobutyrivibrio sp.]|nr:diguanylate cyclase [Pseudobutyrivibrio sp.]